MRNLTGIPNTDTYVLGRGKLYVSEINATTGKPLAYRDLGNCPEFNLLVETDSLEHESSMTGLKLVDKEVVLKQALKVSFRLEELSDENLALFLSGTSHTGSAPIGHTAAVSNVVFCADGNIVKGRWYDIINGAGDRVYGIEGILVQTTQGSPVTLTENTDYTVDREFGRVFLLSTGTAVNAAISANKGLKATLSAYATPTASDVTEVRSLLRSKITVALKFVGENAVNNKKMEYQFHKLTLRPSGDEALISDDWTNMPFEGTAEKSLQADADSPTLTIRSVSTRVALQLLNATVNTATEQLFLTFNIPMQTAPTSGNLGMMALDATGGIWDPAGSYTVGGPDNKVVTIPVTLNPASSSIFDLLHYNPPVGSWIWSADEQVLSPFSNFPLITEDTP